VALSSTKAFVKDPVSYAKGVNYLTLLDVREKLTLTRLKIENDINTNNFTYEKAKQIENNLVFALSRNKPSQILQAQLYLNQGGGGDLTSQLLKIGQYAGSQLISDIDNSFKYKNYITEIQLGASIIKFLTDNCPVYTRYVNDIKNSEKDYTYEGSQYYKEVIQQSIKEIIRLPSDQQVSSTDQDRNALNLKNKTITNRIINIKSDRLSTAKEIAKIASLGDYDKLCQYFIPIDYLYNVSSERDRIRLEYPRYKESEVKTCIKSFMNLKIEYLKFEDIGTNDFSDNELDELKRTNVIYNAGDVRIHINDSNYHINIRLFKYNGVWYFSEAEKSL
jgi:hypothetical protein